MSSRGIVAPIASAEVPESTAVAAAEAWIRCGVASGSRPAISRFDRPGRLAVAMSISPGWTVFESPIGTLTLVAGPTGITNIYFPGRRPRLPEAARRPLPDAVDQLKAYFAGELQAFELDLDLRGTQFQRQVWQRLLEIPYGATTTYGEVARKVDESLYDP